MRTRSRDMTPAQAHVRANWVRLSFLLLLVCCGTRAEPVKAESSLTTDSSEVHDSTPGARVARSASHRFLRLISDYSDEDDRLLQSYIRPERRRVRVEAMPVLPVLLVDAEVPEREITYKLNRRQLIDDYEDDNVDSWRPRAGRRRTGWPAYIYDDQSSDEEYSEFQYEKRLVSRRPVYSDLRRPYGGRRKVARPVYTQDDREEEYHRHSATQRPVVKEASGPRYIPSAESSEVKITVASLPLSQLLAQYVVETSTAGDILPAILQSRFDSSERRILHDNEDDGELEELRNATAAREQTKRPPESPKRTPRRPRFTKPLKLRAVLTVPRAGYLEPYTAWWDPNTGDSRIHFQEGSTVTFRKNLLNGLVQRVEMQVDRTGKRVVRCGVATTAASAADRANPALPDINLFSFSGYESTGDEPLERWEHTTTGRGDARGENVTARHELLLARDADDSARPVRYRVSVNCSILGPDCDGYEHYYSDARTHSRDPKFFEPNINGVCDEVEQLNINLPEDLARLEPLREFTTAARDTRYTDFFELYQKENDRQYDDDIEEAIRKNILRHKLRFVLSGNRAGASYRMGINFLSDRLDAEVERMAGGPPGAAPGDAPAPDLDPSLPARLAALPDRFDWRAQGAVSEVQHQGDCSSCWAFAVAGAVEGALFRRIGRLVPLSVQNLIDCAGPFGGKGCHGTRPSAAFDYVKAQGLPALKDYTPYNEEVNLCKENMAPAVTRISAYVNITQTVPMMQLAIKENGPVVVQMHTKNIQNYKNGVLYTERCSVAATNHVLLAVGWDVHEGEPYFIVKNSWSAKWGEAGYARVQARGNVCGLLDFASYPRLQDDDVLRKD